MVLSKTQDISVLIMLEIHYFEPSQFHLIIMIALELVGSQISYILINVVWRRPLIEGVAETIQNLRCLILEDLSVHFYLSGQLMLDDALPLGRLLSKDRQPFVLNVPILILILQ